MKVNELIDRLNELPLDADIFFLSENEENVFELVQVDEIDMDPESGTPRAVIKPIGETINLDNYENSGDLSERDEDLVV